MLEKMKVRKPMSLRFAEIAAIAFGLVVIAYAAHGIEHVHFEDSCLERLVSPITGE